MIRSITLSLALLTVSSVAQSGVVYFDPSNPMSNVGDEVTLSLLGKDFDTATPVDGGGINLVFDSSVLQLKSVVVDASTWEFSTDPGTADNTNGTLSDLTFSSFAGRSGNFAIAQITFQALNIGTSALSLTESSFNPFASGGQLLGPAVSFSNAELKVVPLPTTVWLFGTGLMALLGFNRRNSNI